MNKRFIYVVAFLLLVIILLLLIFVFYFLDATVASTLKWIVGGIMTLVISLCLNSISQITKLQNLLSNNPIGLLLKRSQDEADQINRKIALAAGKIALKALIMIGVFTVGSKDVEKNKHNEKSKQKTVVDLYLLNEKKKLLQGKLAGLITVTISLAYIVATSAPVWFLVPGNLLIIFNTLKEEVLSYRVEKGYFGRDVDEALQLIKFIHENIDDINNNDGNGAARKILNNKDQEIKEFVLGWNGEQNA